MTKIGMLPFKVRYADAITTPMEVVLRINWCKQLYGQYSNSNFMFTFL